MQFVRRRGERNKQKRDMKKKEAYNEDLANEAEVASGEGKTPQEGASGDNMAAFGADNQPDWPVSRIGNPFAALRLKQ